IPRNGLFKDFALGTHPVPPTGGACRYVWNHHMVGRYDKSDEVRLRQNITGYDTAPLSHVVGSGLCDGDRVQAAPSSSLFSAASSSGCSASSSIQPALTRAFMMIASASVAVRLKPSSAPTMRVRSLSLPCS